MKIRSRRFSKNSAILPRRLDRKTLQIVQSFSLRDGATFDAKQKQKDEIQ
jgi:hypothetical protein